MAHHVTTPPSPIPRAERWTRPKKGSAAPPSSERDEARSTPPSIGADSTPTSIHPPLHLPRLRSKMPAVECRLVASPVAQSPTFTPAKGIRKTTMAFYECFVRT
ncbi:hypothetical protein BDP55DRAFT_655261 [Colletotrichum godetiae]|uniref:Uncharacterized protein n=1 Tax=Colletotrichum godetiae TaxID=1209918 RepID=A0AAJ0F0S3_9PEZI|nr:uncharacterized protein BDP55DRAFT_655261 [Colletotrichum godetiae]KAK1688798.1 hypothetical protein BDP55DRAFT_655261 [Colletotrichum godetiae]